jgi:hypothetical protein
MKLKQLFATSLLLVLGSSAAMAAGASSDDAFKFGDSSLEEFDETGGALRLIIRFAFYIMYLIGGLMLAASGFKLKAGDMPGFYKMAAGGVFVFLSPFLIDALVNIGDSGPGVNLGN